MKAHYKLLILLVFTIAFSGCDVEDQIVIDLPMGKSSFRIDLRVPAEESGDRSAGLGDNVDPIAEPYPNPTDIPVTGRNGEGEDPEPELEEKSDIEGSYKLTFGDSQLFSALSYYKNDKVEISVKNATLKLQNGAGVPAEEFRDLVLTASIDEDNIATYENPYIAGTVERDSELDAFVETVMAWIEARREVTFKCEGILIGVRDEDKIPGRFLIFLVLGMEGDAKVTVNR